MALMMELIMLQSVQNTLYEKTAKLLIQQVWTDCGVYTNLSFASGLLGIGFLVEFLHQQGIVYGNPDEILFDLDNRVQIVNPLKIDDETVDNGLLGIIAYVCSRVIGCVNRNKETLSLFIVCIFFMFIIYFFVVANLIFLFVLSLDKPNIVQIQTKYKINIPLPH